MHEIHVDNVNYKSLLSRYFVIYISEKEQVPKEQQEKTYLKSSVKSQN